MKLVSKFYLFTLLPVLVSCNNNNSDSNHAMVAPYGTWKSPITAETLLEKSIRLGGLKIEDDYLYWSEGRPNEGGRNVIVRKKPNGEIEEINPAPMNARSRVHEYGGGSWLVHHGSVFFSNFADQRVYRKNPSNAPYPITPETAWRFADGSFDEQRNRIYYVREDHTDPRHEPINTIVSIDAEGNGEPWILATGHDFYSNPRLSPTGDKLCWIAWNHPNMPWDDTELWVASLDSEGKVGKAQKVAGGVSESVIQPSWSPNGTLYFISDKSNWWNLYRFQNGQIEHVVDRAAEFGGPSWRFGISNYTFASEDRILCSFNESGTWNLAELDTQSLNLNILKTPFTSFGSIQVNGNILHFIGASPTQSAAIVELDRTSGEFAVIKQSSALQVDQRYLSKPESIEFPTEGGLTAHAYFYPPSNQDYQPPEGEKSPLIVFIHGGPTGATSDTLSLSKQFWTSRGFAIVDVNYGGSTGYGREYRKRLEGQWGIVDVQDCTQAALHLAKQGKVDRDRLAIRGGSAGGFTTLACLVFNNTFKAGASYFGVSDLSALAQDTHKFESRYLDSLIGPYPDKKYVYDERSPINHLNNIESPLILLQGLEDKIVPPNQAELMFNALLKKGLPVSHITYEGEQHGFRKAENIKHSLESELYFYSRIFGFDAAGDIEAIEIHNLN